MKFQLIDQFGLSQGLQGEIQKENAQMNCEYHEEKREWQ